MPFKNRLLSRRKTPHCFFGPSCRLGRTDTYSRSKFDPSQNFRSGQKHRYLSDPLRDGTTDRRRIRQMISCQSIAHVAEFISRNCHRSISEISPQSFSLSRFLSRSSSQCKSISFLFFPNFYYIFFSMQNVSKFNGTR